ncbi:unnamed protein product [Triticum turgidum subsp. durum]|uniref:Uncharacterized protein n=1 Tax=Triticum turgidum subsp. durum TaxID=4567 RepID=A0A9R1PYF0_TRITD|nr:unnamed protein product [Triticum turgidum subsp. durum]
MAKRLAVALLLVLLLASSDAGELNGKHGAGSAVGEMKAPSLLAGGSPALDGGLPGAVDGLAAGLGLPGAPPIVGVLIPGSLPFENPAPTSLHDHLWFMC